MCFSFSVGVVQGQGGAAVSDVMILTLGIQYNSTTRTTTVMVSCVLERCITFVKLTQVYVRNYISLGTFVPLHVLHVLYEGLSMEFFKNSTSTESFYAP